MLRVLHDSVHVPRPRAPIPVYLRDGITHDLLGLVEALPCRYLLTIRLCHRLLQRSLLDHPYVLLDPSDTLLDESDLLAYMLRFLQCDLVSVLGHTMQLFW